MPAQIKRIVTIRSQTLAKLAEQVLRPHTGLILSLAFSRNGVLGLGCSDNKVELWRVADAKLLGTLSVGWVGAEGLAFHPDGSVLAAVSGNAVKFSLWNVANRIQIRQVNVPVGHQPGCVSITSSGQTIATGGFEGQLLFWDWQAGNPQLRSTLAAHQSYISSIAFSPDGLFLASGDFNGELRLWQVGFDFAPQLRWGLRVNDRIAQLSFNGPGTMLAATSWDGNVYLMNVSDGSAIGELTHPRSGQSTQMLSGAFAPKDPLIASSQGGVLQFWDASTEQLLLEKQILCDKVLFSPDGVKLAVVRNNPGASDIPTIWSSS
jgi:WD40 repeat protein